MGRIVPHTLIGFVVGLMAVSHVASAQSRTTPPKVDLSGFWMLRFDPARDVIMPSGNSLTGYIPPAPLTAEAARAVKAAEERAESVRNTIPTSVVGEASKWCRPGAYPFFMRSPEAVDIIQGDRQVMVTGDRPMAMRHIYLDQKSHPEGWEPTIMGHAIGWWDGDTLVADSVGFLGGAIPGALATTPRTHLVERYRLLPDGRLSIVFTWDDPTMFIKPHSYELFYYRQPPGTYALENFCDPSDSRQYTEPIAPPPQPRQ
jgi:hypothetical protein